MGSQTLNNYQTLKFIQQLQDTRFGRIDIYLTQDGRFMMKSQRTHIIGDNRHILFKKIMDWIVKQRQEYVVPIMHIENKIESGLCIQIEASEIYTEYYNFTLLDLVRTKKEMEQPQIWFIFQALLILATTLRKNKFAANLNIDNVFITLKGIPCIYYNQFLSFQESINYTEYSMGQQISIILLQICIAQQIVLSQQSESKDLLPFVARVCSRHRLLGRLTKQLLNRQKNQQEILQEIQNLIQQNKINKFNQIKLNKFRYALPQTSALKSSNKHSQNQNKTNQPIGFKPKKSIDKQNLKKKVDSKSQNSIKKDANLKNQTAKRMNQILPTKEETQRLFRQLARRKEQSKIKMQMVAIKKQQLNIDKQNKEYNLMIRKRSQSKKNKQKKLTQQSKCSNYR